MFNSPSIAKLLRIHEGNQKKERKAQSANKRMVLEYQERKNLYSIKSQEKLQQLGETLAKTREHKVEELKNKN